MPCVGRGCRVCDGNDDDDVHLLLLILLFSLDDHVSPRVYTAWWWFFFSLDDDGYDVISKEGRSQKPSCHRHMKIVLLCVCDGCDRCAGCDTCRVYVFAPVGTHIVVTVATVAIVVIDRCAGCDTCRVYVFAPVGTRTPTTGFSPVDSPWVCRCPSSFPSIHPSHPPSPLPSRFDSFQSKPRCSACTTHKTRLYCDQ